MVALLGDKDYKVDHSIGSQLVQVPRTAGEVRSLNFEGGGDVSGVWAVSRPASVDRQVCIQSDSE